MASEVSLTYGLRPLAGEITGETLLTSAIMNGEEDLARRLLAHRCTDLNEPNSDGLPPLAVAMIKNNLNLIATMLLDERVDPNAFCSDFGTLLSLAAMNDSAEAADLLLKHPHIDPNYCTPLVTACAHGSVKVVEAFLQHEMIDVNKPDESGLTPLCAAILSENAEILTLLLKQPGIDPNLVTEALDNSVCPDLDYFHPLTVAALLDHPKMADILIADRRVNPISMTLPGLSPFAVSIIMGKSQIGTVSVRQLPIDERASGTRTAPWTCVSLLPVSNDRLRFPPEKFIKNLKEFSPAMMRSRKYGEIEIVKEDCGNSSQYYRVIYRCHQFVTLTLLKDGYPLGVTMYKPLLPLAKSMRSLKAKMIACGHFWHIDNKKVARNPAELHEALSRMGRERLAVFRALNADHDPHLLLNNMPLKGRGHSKRIITQVDQGGTALVSTSTRPMSKFLVDKRVKNGGFTMIFLGYGARLVSGEDEIVPGFWDHDYIYQAVSPNERLQTRVKEAAEAMFHTPVDPNLIVYLDGGFPTPSGFSSKPPKRSEALDKKVKKMLASFKLKYRDLPKEIQELLLSSKSPNNKKKALEDFVNKEKQL